MNDKVLKRLVFSDLTSLNIIYHHYQLQLFKSSYQLEHGGDRMAQWQWLLLNW